MNACEPLMIAKMNLKPSRGRSIEMKRVMALQELRRERQIDNSPYCLGKTETGKLIKIDKKTGIRIA